ncbi:MAG: hypothetical protein ACI4AK_01980 [Lepagella sp.]
MNLKNITAIGLMSVVIASCGGKGLREDRQDSMDVSDSTATEVVALSGDSVFYITADSIGSVHVGEKISALPPVVDFLYDEMVTTATPDAMAYTFLLKSVPQFMVYDFMQGQVDVIALEGNARSVNTPEGELRVGDSFKRVLALKGVESEWIDLDDMGVWYWKWNGLYFGVDETNLSDEQAEALCDGKLPPRASLLGEEVKIGYIATGLPF